MLHTNASYNQSQFFLDILKGQKKSPRYTEQHNWCFGGGRGGVNSGFVTYSLSPQRLLTVPRGIRRRYRRHEDIDCDDISRQDYEYDAPLQD